MNAERVAEVRVQQDGTSVYAQVRRMSQGSMELQVLADHDSGVALLRPGTPVLLTIASRARLYAGAAVVADRAGRDLTLTMAGALRSVERRRGDRTEIALPVMIRVLYPDGSFGPWQPGTTLNASLGGLLLSTPLDAGASRYVEVRMGPAGADRQDAREPIRARARIAHCHPQETGGHRVGLAFTSIAHLDTLRLMRVLQ